MKRGYKYMKCDTFWNKIRVKGGYSIYDIATLLGVSRSTANYYMLGKIVPRAKHIDTLCEFFGVDKVQGEREFYEAHRHYDENKHRTKVDIEQAEHIEEQLKAAREYNERVAARNTPAPEPEVELAVEDNNIFKLVYGVLSYQEFNQFFDAVASKNGDALELIYGKVDFDTYEKIAQIIQEG